jgi:alginate O-acetyltransferase complex protein AlgI
MASSALAAQRPGEVFYDASCDFCVTTAYRFRRTLERCALTLTPLQTPDAAKRLNVSDAHLMDAMRLRLEDGQVYSGADAIVQIARRVWWAIPVWVLSFVPGVMPLLRAAYASIARRRHCATGVCAIHVAGPRSTRFRDVIPLVALAGAALATRGQVAPWVFMCAMALALDAGCKWLALSAARTEIGYVEPGGRLSFLLLWPGMDGAAFLSRAALPEPPSIREWCDALARVLAGALLLWGIAPSLMVGRPLLAGWVVMAGLVLLLHFGTFHLLSLFWRGLGRDAAPLMRQPLRATSVAEVWGRRWNTAFHELAVRFTFAPLRRMVGAGAASFAVFLLSGAIHELVITVPARAGYGLPTMYFLIQALGMAAERSEAGRLLGVRGGVRGRAFTALVTAGPAFWLFPPPFVERVILPLAAAFGAR